MHVGFQNLKLKEGLAYKNVSFYRTWVRSLATLVTNLLTHSRLVNLIDVTEACEVVTVVDDEKRFIIALVKDGDTAEGGAILVTNSLTDSLTPV